MAGSMAPDMRLFIGKSVGPGIKLKEQAPIGMAYCSAHLKAVLIEFLIGAGPLRGQFLPDCAADELC